VLGLQTIIVGQVHVESIQSYNARVKPPATAGEDAPDAAPVVGEAA